MLMAVVGLSLGLLIGWFGSERYAPVEHKTEAELQLAEYKEAEAICGVGNVMEKSFIRREGREDKVIGAMGFLCEDMEFASLSEASRSAVLNGDRLFGMARAIRASSGVNIPWSNLRSASLKG